MLECTFKLNNQNMSALAVGALSFPAFSGLGEYVNQRTAICLANFGPIPPGVYYIFDRQSGGRLGPVRDLFGKRSDWFALHAIDGSIDDETFCNLVKRGQFRLHPKGEIGISQGCITLERQVDFQQLSALLRRKPPVAVPGSDLKAYGKVVVS